MATLTTQQIAQTGLTPTYAAVAAADKFTPGDNVFLELFNTNAATRTVTVDSKVPSNYGTDVDVGPITLAATTGHSLIGPFPAQRFAGSDGLADVVCSATAGVTIAVLRL